MRPLALRPAHVAIGLLAALLVTGCKPSKKEKCTKMVQTAADLAESMGKALGGDIKMSDAEKKEAIEKCIATPDDELECATDPAAAKEPKCVELMKKKATVEWESATVLKGRAKAQIPKGWSHEEFLGDSYSPKESAFTSYRVNDTCGGACTARTAAEWEKIVDDEVTSTAEFGGKPTKDERPTPTTRVVVHGDGRHKTISVSLWHEGAAFYVKCEAQLDEPWSANLDAFEKACLATEPTWDEKK